VTPSKSAAAPAAQSLQPSGAYSIESPIVQHELSL
jgi:hypothetical protein